MVGEDHPDTAWSYDRLALCLASRGKYSDAESLHRMVLGIRRKVFGEDHPDTARTYHSLADCLYYQAKYADAEPFYRKAIAVRVKAFSSTASGSVRSV